MDFKLKERRAAASGSAERLFGYRAAEIIGKPITVLIPRDRLLEEDLILQRLRRGERIEYLKTGRAKIIGIGREVQGLKRWR